MDVADHCLLRPGRHLMIGSIASSIARQDQPTGTSEVQVFARLDESPIIHWSDPPERRRIAADAKRLSPAEQTLHGVSRFQPPERAGHDDRRSEEETEGDVSAKGVPARTSAERRTVSADDSRLWPSRA